MHKLADILVLILLPSFVWADETTLIGRVTFVRDGDTIQVGGIGIRLNGISAPEQRQLTRPHGWYHSLV